MKQILLSASLGAMMAATAFAETPPIHKFEADCERALALSAAPAYMRDQSGVYLLGDEGFVLDRESGNGYHCMVVRENYQGVVPQCFDENSRDGHIKVYLDEAKKMLAGASTEDIRAERATGFEKGIYKSASGHGVVYMASAYNFVFTLPDQRRHIAPHVMYHAPNKTNEDIGAVMPEAAVDNLGMPFLISSGPLGFMIGFTEKPTDSAEVEEACAGQLPNLNDWAESPRPWRNAG